MQNVLLYSLMKMGSTELTWNEVKYISTEIEALGGWL